MMKSLLATLTILVLLAATAANAQTIRPRGAGPAPAVTVTTPATTAPATTPTPTTTTTTATGPLVISGPFPGSVEATRDFEVPLTVTGGTGPYKWEASEGLFYGVEGSKAVFYSKAPSDRETDAFEATITVTDSSTPALTGEREVGIALTPFVPTPAETYEMAQGAKAAAEGAMRLDQRMFPNTANRTTVGEVLAKSHYGNGAIFSPDLIGRRNERLHQKVNWLIYGMAGFAGMLIVATGFGVWRMMRNTRPAARRVASIVCIVGLGLASQVSAQTPAAAKAPPACTIRAILVDYGVVVKEQDPVPVTLNVRNCGEVKSVVAMVNETTPSTEITFTNVSTKGNVVSAKVAASASATTGPIALKVVQADGTETTSPDAVYLLVLDTQTAQVRKDMRADTSRATREAAAAKKAVAELKAKVEAVAASQLTKTEVEAIVAPLRKKVADLELVSASLQKRADETDQRLTILADVAAGLAEGQVLLANTGVKKGIFSGKKPLNPEVAEAAERIRQAALQVR